MISRSRLEKLLIYSVMLHHLLLNDIAELYYSSYFSLNCLLTNGFLKKNGDYSTSEGHFTFELNYKSQILNLALVFASKNFSRSLLRVPNIKGLSSSSIYLILGILNSSVNQSILPWSSALDCLSIDISDFTKEKEV